MIHRLLIAAAALLFTAAAEKGFEHPETDGMDPALAEQIIEARELVDDSADQSPAEHAAAWGELGMLYQATNFADAALGAYARAMAIDPFDGRWPYLRGIELGERGRTDAARTAFLQALALDRGLAGPAWTRIGRLLLDAGEPDQALQAFERALAIDDGDAAALAGAGEAHLALERYAPARDHLQRALEAEPRANRLNYPLAMAWRGLGNEAAMQEHLERAGQVGVAPDDPVAEYLAAHAAGSRVHILQGRKAWRAGDIAGAAAAFERAVSADPDSAVGWTNLGTAQAALDRLEPARESLTRSIELDPASDRARQNLVTVLRRLGQPRQALAVIEEAPGPMNSSRWRLVESARIRFNLGDADNAADRMVEALELRRDIELWTEALTALVEADRHDEAFDLATHEDLSRDSDEALDRWLRQLVDSAARGAERLALAARLSEHLYERTRNESRAALHINTLLKRDENCRAALDWIEAQKSRADLPEALAALLPQWSQRLAETGECEGANSEAGS